MLYQSIGDRMGKAHLEVSELFIEFDDVAV
jgi:hypothetical protein